MNLLDVLRREGVVPLLAGFLLNGLALALGYFIKRKRLSWREGYNSKIGLAPDLAERNPMFEPFLATFENASSLIIRVRNAGRSTIAEEDYLEPLRFVFPNRFILDFRVSEPQPPNIRDKIEKGAYVSRIIDDFGEPPGDLINLQALRDDLPRLSETSNGDPFGDAEKNARRQLTIPNIELKSKQRFTIAIYLRESTLSPGLKSTSKEYDCWGKIRSGKLIDRRVRNKKITPTGVLAVLCILLLGGLAATIFIPSDPGKERYCVEGEMMVIGSSAFASVADSISRAYMQACAGASVAIRPNGSLEGIQVVLRASPADSSRLATLSDGQASGSVGALVGKPVALLVYSVVVNKEAGIDNLSLEQIQGIYQGRYTNWQQLGGATDLPIRMVSRDAGSGSRQTFEKYVFGDQEGALSSNSCDGKDRDPAALTIRCERGSTSRVLDEVDRIPGAIGYADEGQVAEYRSISRVRIDGLEPTAQYLKSGYPFWTIEYLYTNGVPTVGSLLNGYVDYISSDAARSRIHDAGYTPCVQSDGRILDLCQVPR